MGTLTPLGSNPINGENKCIWLEVRVRAKRRDFTLLLIAIDDHGVNQEYSLNKHAHSDLTSQLTIYVSNGKLTFIISFGKAPLIFLEYSH